MMRQKLGGEPLVLHCPECDARHIDEGDWAARPHKTHLCAACGHEWRPFDHPTVGIAGCGKRFRNRMCGVDGYFHGDCLGAT